MKWKVVFHPDFEGDFDKFSEEVQDAILARTDILEIFGPTLGRPKVDTLKDSRHANMKELRLDADDGVWRVAFAFDPKRQAVLLIAGDKTGTNERLFYKQLIRKADKRFDDWLNRLKGD